MAQDRVTRGGTFQGEMDRYRESQDWTVAFGSMPERDVKNQGEGSPKQAGSDWFSCHSWLATSGANFYLLGGFRAVFLREVNFVLFCFRLFAFTEAAALRLFDRSLFFDMYAPRQPLAVLPKQLSASLYVFVSLEMSLFPSIFGTITVLSLYEECAIRFFLPGGVFLMTSVYVRI